MSRGRSKRGTSKRGTSKRGRSSRGNRRKRGGKRERTDPSIPPKPIPRS
jgi:hypothetical protein